MSLNQIINVQIDRQTSIPSRTGFGVPLILGRSSKLSQKVQVFSSIESVAGVFASSDPEYIMAQKLLSQTFVPPTFLIGDWDTGETLAENLDAIRDINDDWYCLLLDSAVKADIEAAAAYIEPLVKIHIAMSSDAAIFDSTSTTDVAYALKAAGYDRTALIAKKTGVTDYPHAAWAGEMLPRLPGEATWAYKTLRGVTFDVLTPNEKAAALRNDSGTGKNANVYTRVAGVSITQDGNMVSGEYIDVMRGVDFIRARIQERVYFRLVNSPKIPYTNAGVNVIVNEIKAVLATAINQNILRDDPAPVAFGPDVADVDPIDRGNRFLPDVTFQGELAGAIHRTEIRGVVSV